MEREGIPGSQRQALYQLTLKLQAIGPGSPTTSPSGSCSTVARRSSVLVCVVTSQTPMVL